MSLKEKVIEELRQEGYLVVLKEEFNKLVEKLNEVIEPVAEEREFGVAQKLKTRLKKRKLKQKTVSFPTSRGIVTFPARKEKKIKGDLSPSEEKVFDAIKSGCETKEEVMEKASIPEGTARTCMSRLFRRNKIKKLSYGRYAWSSTVLIKDDELDDEPVKITERQSYYSEKWKI
ncbi:unnamed protein product [marine sediment metagenome]|uniref:Uncharacterized protein n=1 Tax=marine sediment metagenome TaxID=412755 RepID=X1CT71_9ZZZZ